MIDRQKASSSICQAPIGCHTEYLPQLHDRAIGPYPLMHAISMGFVPFIMLHSILIGLAIDAGSPSSHVCGVFEQQLLNKRERVLRGGRSSIELDK